MPQDWPPELQAVMKPAWSREELTHRTRWDGCLVPTDGCCRARGDHLRRQTKSFREGWLPWRGLLALCPAWSSLVARGAQQVTTQRFTPTTSKPEAQPEAISMSNT